jgi:hypothetical protein
VLGRGFDSSEFWSVGRCGVQGLVWVRLDFELLVSECGVVVIVRITVSFHALSCRSFCCKSSVLQFWSHSVFIAPIAVYSFLQFFNVC